ncbi:MAG: DUF2442 domain-containing protein [Kouleothrix sp.]|nr:DUF2442 domain-containing protein [Kouleothrix sp.]
MTPLIRVRSVTPADQHRAQIVFTNGETREIDLTPYIATGPIFEPVRTDPTMFRSMRVEGGTIAWPNGADIDPDVLYYNGAPPWAQQLEPTTAESH